ncbi:MAG: hypothetical protein LAO03_13980 [Acidobacteriia bacterium]|nr:hypothetical protein [Terriglobia bacterium]
MAWGFGREWQEVQGREWQEVQGLRLLGSRGVFPPQPAALLGVKALMDQPLSPRIVELEALLELRQAHARQISELAVDFSDPRVRQECEQAAGRVHEEVESIQRELGELLAQCSYQAESKTGSAFWARCPNAGVHEA